MCIFFIVDPRDLLNSILNIEFLRHSVCEKIDDISIINIKNKVMTTRRNSNRGFGTMDSDEQRRSGRGSHQSQGRSQNRDEYESDYEDYSDDDDEDQGNRYVSSSRNQYDWDEDDNYDNYRQGISGRNRRSGMNYQDDYDDYDDSGNWGSGKGRNQSRGYGYDDYNDRNSESSFSRRGFGSMSRQMGSGYGGNSDYSNEDRDQYSRGQNRGRSNRSGMGSGDHDYRGRNQSSRNRYGNEGYNSSWGIGSGNWGTGSNEGRGINRGYSEDQYLGRGQNLSRGYDDDYNRSGRNSISSNSGGFRKRGSSGSSGRRSGRNNNW